jgi:hypothetical protein
VTPSVIPLLTNEINCINVPSLNWRMLMDQILCTQSFSFLCLHQSGEVTHLIVSLSWSDTAVALLARGTSDDGTKAAEEW